MGEDRCIKGFWVWRGNLRERDHLDEPSLDVNLKMDLQEVGLGLRLD
jgi:hypothetical protein